MLVPGRTHWPPVGEDAAATGTANVTSRYGLWPCAVSWASMKRFQ